MSENKVKAFYGQLVELVQEQIFDEEKARSLFQEYEGIKPSLTIRPVTILFLRDAHGEHFHKGTGIPVLESIAEAALRDLAPEMGDQEAQKIFEELVDLSGTSKTDLFVHMRDVTPLSPESNKIAIVTLIVNNLDKLSNLLRARHPHLSTVEVIHSV